MRTSPLLLAFLASSLFVEARTITSLNNHPWVFEFNGEKQQVFLPHTWNAQDGADGPKNLSKPTALSVQGNDYARGMATYQTKLALEPQAGKRYFIKLDGASVISEVIINGNTVGKHEGAFTASCYEITPFLKDKNNELTIRVDNTQTNYIAPQAGDFTTFGGLYRPVNLITTDALCINPTYFASPGVFITPTLDQNNQGKVKVDVHLSNSKPSTGNAEITFTIKDPSGEAITHKTVTIPNNEEKIVKQIELSVPKPKLWSAHKNAAVYTLETCVKDSDGSEDTVIEPFGFRSVAFSPQNGFSLNGKPMQIRGVNRHQDKKNQGWALTPQDEELDIQYITQMGANGLRTAHYPQSENIYNLCDKNGILVWSEIPCIEKVRPTVEFRDNTKLQAKEMILQNYNHPSIILWGVFNEIYHQCSAEEAAVKMEKELKEYNDYMKKLDPTRHTVCATNMQGRSELNEITDVLCANGYPGWYGGGPKGMKNFIEGYNKQYPNKAFGISEYGHGASIYQHESPVKQPKPTHYWHPEEWQAYAHEENYRAIKAQPKACWGTFIWNMFDFATDARNEGDHPGINDKGLVTYDRTTPKDAYYFYKANWNHEPMIHITSKRFKIRKHDHINIKAYTNLSVVTLIVNGKEIQTKQPDSEKVVEWQNIPLEKGTNVIKVHGKDKHTHISDTATWILANDTIPTDQTDKFDNR